MSVDASEQLLRDSATIHAFRRDIGNALCDLAARPLDEAAATRMHALIGQRATEARAALRRLRSVQQRSTSRPVLRLVTTNPGGGVQAAPPAPSRRPARSVMSHGGAA